MSVALIAAIVGATLLVLLAAGVPVAFSLGLTALFSVVLLLTGDEFGYLAHLTFDSVNSFALLAIPLFVLMGAIFGQSKASRDLLETAHVWLGRVRGGLAISSVLACAAFAALTGSSPATSAAIGRIAIPEMVRRGYPNGVAAGAIVGGGTLGILIPPSVTLILYGVSTETSVGRLFLAGVGPGILVTALFCVWIVVAMRLRRPAAVGAAEHAPRPVTEEMGAATLRGVEGWRRRFLLLAKALPFLALMAGVLVVLYAGIATPSEAAAMGCLLSAVLVGIFYRSVTVRSLLSAALETTRTSTMILLIVAFSAVLGQVLSFLDVPQELASLVADMEVNRWVIFVAMNLLFLALGLVIPPVAIILITMPVLFPIITELGFDPIWFGIVMTLNMEMGLITPPVGLNLYVVQGIVPDMPTRDILIGSLPYVAVLAIGILLLVIFPDVVTWLPDQLHSRPG